MKAVGTFQSKRWGQVLVSSATYQHADGPLAIQLSTDEGEPLATLSVNMYRPECSRDSTELPADCFFVKEWGGNEDLAREAMASGLFIKRDDLGVARSGYVTAPVWQVAPAAVQEGGAA
jgi:hypothetical protein